MKVNKRYLKRIIKEEKNKLIREMFGNDIEVPNDLITFAKAYSGLGDAVSSQIDELVDAYVNEGEQSDRFRETAYEVNPNAVDMAMRRLGGLYLDECRESYEDVMGALKAAKKIYMEGDEEVARDKAAAEGRL